MDSPEAVENEILFTKVKDVPADLGKLAIETAHLGIRVTVYN